MDDLRRRIREAAAKAIDENSFAHELRMNGVELLGQEQKDGTVTYVHHATRTMPEHYVYELFDTSPAFPSPPHFAFFGRGGFLDHRLCIPPQRAHSGVLMCGCGVGLSCAVGGPQTGLQRLTRQFALRGGIWLRPGPIFGAAAGGKCPVLNGSGGSCRDCCLSISFRACQNSCSVSQ